ncbi:MAG TPA: alkyl sulfatase dimerization domain-containing protein [Acidimicrobiia bacterium]
MPDMLDRSARIIEGSERLEMRGLLNIGAGDVAEVADNVALVESFSNVVAFATGDTLTVFDVSHELFAPNALTALRRWSAAPVQTAVYTHGHVDHVTGAHVFDAEAERGGAAPIRYVGHESVPARFDRYKLTNGYNGVINQRQFRLPEPLFPSEFRYPDEVYAASRSLETGDTMFELHHARGETDDHTWAWVPSHRALCVGDLFIWQFPNAGNPQKEQRHAWDWAVALRAMAALDAELLLPAHGPAIGGARYVRQVLTDTADALESLHTQTLDLMNAGARLDDVVHSVRLPDLLAARPYLQPTYDEPEFVVRNLWRLYGGWYDGNPAHLKPASDLAIARETAALAGGADQLAARAEALAADGDLRLACHLAEMAALAAPDARRVHEVRAAVYEARRAAEASFMASGIYRSAALDSQARLEELDG